MTRRAALALGAGSAALTVIGWNEAALATPKAAADDIAKFTGGKTAEAGKVSI
ncbi:MAG: thiosulfate oxidation carrier protein SoxY, partial [Rhodopseudomonas sp.]|nr:thiosulfate oxidation carrier protein SoxY [Rhodopseudomonas sp.]